MKTRILLLAAGVLCGAGVLVARAQTNLEDLAGSTTKAAALKSVLSDRPLWGTPPVLTLSGDYVNTPLEDYESFGVWDQPFTLEQMNGVVTELAFGAASKQGQWQLVYRLKLMNMDPSAQAVNDLNRGLNPEDRRAQIIKANYNVRDWWRLGIAAVFEDKPGTDANADPVTLGPRGGQTLGLQLDSSFKF